MFSDVLSSAAASSAQPRDHVAPVVEIVVPVHNEQAALAASIRRLRHYLVTAFPLSYRVTIADNASTDSTWAIARSLSQELRDVRAIRLDEKGRGRALRQAWAGSDATVLAYMDVDLSTDLNALLPLVAPLVSGHSDVAIGSRLARSARVLRGPKRELISRSYNLILHAALATRFTDAQCGFKAIRADAAHALLPLVHDDAWFFDTELLVLAERAGLRIHEVPVDWTDDPDSRVDIVSTAAADLKGVARLVRSFARGTIPLEHVPAWLGRTAPAPVHRMAGQVIRFAAIGVLSTLAYLVLYVALRTGLPAQQSNAISLLVTAVGNTTANRRYTFAIRGRARAIRHQVQGLVVFAIALGVTSGSLTLLDAADPRAGRVAEVAVLVSANLVATALRFLLLHTWVFRRRDASVPATVIDQPQPADARSA